MRKVMLKALIQIGECRDNVKAEANHAKADDLLFSVATVYAKKDNP